MTGKIQGKVLYTIEYISIAILFLFIEFVTIFFPVYIAYIQKFAIKARSIVYGYWVVNEKARYKDFLFEMTGDVISNYFFLEERLLAFDVKLFKYNYQITKTFYIGNFNQFDNSTKWKRIYNYIRYKWYYWLVWVWLDDVNSINALNKSIITVYRDNDDLESPINWLEDSESDLKYLGRLKYVNDIQICTNVFEKDYYLGKYKLPPFYKRLWCVKYQYINNFVRDRCCKLSTKTRAFLKNRFGFVYSPELRRSCLTIFGYNVVKRGVKYAR